MQFHDKRGGMYGPAIMAILLAGMFAGVCVDRFMGMGMLAQDDAPLDLGLLRQASNLVQRYYVDRSAEQPPTLTYGAISGMVSALGDTGHSRFLSPEIVREMKQMEQNKFQGIGAEIQLKAGHVVIVAPLDGSPAQRAGLKPGDFILQVNGRDVTGQTLDQVVREVMGRAGTEVTLTILPAGSRQTRQVTLTRATIVTHNIAWQMLPGTTIAHLRISAFEKSLNQDLRNAINEIHQDAATGLVLDLRNNPGGLLDQAIDAASQFLGHGDVLIVKNARGKEHAVPVKTGGEATEIPLVVLINGGTASGAEIVAGALQDGHRAPLLGETTFGTGTVLTEFKLADGSALLLAVEEWLTPDGHVIWHKGITPNVVVALAAGVSPLFPEAERALNAQQFRKSQDTQLLRAVDLLAK